MSAANHDSGPGWDGTQAGAPLVSFPDTLSGLASGAEPGEDPTPTERDRAGRTQPLAPVRANTDAFRTMVSAALGDDAVENGAENDDAGEASSEDDVGQPSDAQQAPTAQRAQQPGPPAGQPPAGQPPPTQPGMLPAARRRTWPMKSLVARTRATDRSMRAGGGPPAAGGPTGAAGGAPPGGQPSAPPGGQPGTPADVPANAEPAPTPRPRGTGRRGTTKASAGFAVAIVLLAVFVLIVIQLLSSLADALSGLF